MLSDRDERRRTKDEGGLRAIRPLSFVNLSSTRLVVEVDAQEVAPPSFLSRVQPWKVPRIIKVRDPIKEHHEGHVGVYGVFTNFVEGSFIGAYIPRIYDEEVGVSPHFVYQKFGFS